MNLRHLLVVRHPETLANSEGRFLGRADSPYTESGRLQAVTLAEELVGFRPSAIWSSPLARSLRVAKSAASDLGLAVHVDDRLVELDFGEAEELTRGEILAAGIPLDLDAIQTPVAPGGETRAQLQTRVTEVLEDILASGERAAVVCHSGVLRACILRLLDLGMDHLWSFEVYPAQLARLTVEDGLGVLHEFRNV
jgi:broad specificity phosphatase PhoE